MKRDPRSLVILFIMPIFMMFIFGYAINMDVKNIRIGVCDLSKSSASRDLISKIKASPYFRIVEFFDHPGRSEAFFLDRSVRAVVLIPREFARDFEFRRFSRIGIIADGCDANTATLVQNYLDGLLSGYTVFSSGKQTLSPFVYKPQVLYNPDMQSSHFVVPGLVVLILMMVGAMLTSVTIAREKETGTLEQILVSPIQAHEVVLGKIIPYFFLAMGIALSILLFGHLWFKVPFLGSWFWLMFFCGLYLFTALAIGLLISTVVSTQQVAMMLALIATMLPSVMLTGFIFPIASMPEILQVLTKFIPATYFLIIIRGIMLKGIALVELWPSVCAMSAIGLFFILIAVKKFSLKLK
ncbi:MAG: ABC transporter permease [Candidatus Aureabacteria bacterium]|nr:ABC transporter permease [Candidatus Auribacterota bacterium]